MKLAILILLNLSFVFSKIGQNLFPSVQECAPYMSNKIFGGSETEIDEFPWMALIEYQKPTSTGFHCGASLISKRYVLTAAHCVSPNSMPIDWKPINVRLGEWDMTTDPDCSDLDRNDCTDPYKNVAIEKTIIHQSFGYNATSQPNDIALLKLAEDVQFTDFIKPICLPSKSIRDKSYTGIAMDIAGWGKTEQASSSSRKMKAMVKGFDLTECSQTYRNIGIILSDSQICAGGAIGVDTCRGDSGGSLVAVDTTSSERPRFVMVGIVSFGPTPCAQAGIPAIYTKVSEYIRWIRRNME